MAFSLLQFISQHQHDRSEPRLRALKNEEVSAGARRRVLTSLVDPEAKLSDRLRPGCGTLLVNAFRSQSADPHVHCVVPGDGLTADGRWIGCRPSFFLPVCVLSRLYRRLFLQRLQAAFVGASWSSSALSPACANRRRSPAIWRRCARSRWVVYAKRPFARLRCQTAASEVGQCIASAPRSNEPK